MLALSPDALSNAGLCAYPGTAGETGALLQGWVPQAMCARGFTGVKGGCMYMQCKAMLSPEGCLSRAAKGSLLSTINCSTS